MWTLIFLLHGMLSTPQYVHGFSTEKECHQAGEKVVSEWPTANYVCIELKGKSSQ